MDILIIEDEAITAEKLEMMLKKWDASVNILAKLASIRQSVSWLNIHKADLIFMDIHLSDGPAFEIFSQVQLVTPIIFTTAYDQYALEAFKVNSIDYLLKPVSQQALKQAMDKYQHLRPSAIIPPDISRLLESFKKHEYQKRFMVSIGQKLRTIPVEEIAYFYAYQKLVFLIHLDSKRYTLDLSLDALESKLNPDIFFRINRQLLISHASIGAMSHYSKSRVKIDLVPPLAEQAEAIVSVERADAFKQWLNR